MGTRRQVLQASGALLVCWLTEPTALAQEAYPGSREVHVIAAYPPGGSADIVARYFSENMRPFLGATIVVENKVGASGNIAINYVAKAKPDGYTILMHPPGAIAAGPSVFKNPGYDPSAFAVLGSACRFAFTVSVAANAAQDAAKPNRRRAGQGGKRELRDHGEFRTSRWRHDEE
jgi:tripartite-type tricarboxylate transporter receptor subunit TctC